MEYKGYEIKCDQDLFSESPREWDNLGKFVLHMKRHDLPCEINFNFDEFDSWQEVEEKLSKEFKVVIPVYAYSHGCLLLKAKSYGQDWWHADWDAGMVGYVVVDEDTIKKEYGSIDEDTIGKVESVLCAEVDEYSKWINGQVYALSIEKDGEEIDCTFGVYDLENAVSEAKSIIDGYIRKDEAVKWQKIDELAY